jgi:transposase
VLQSESDLGDVLVNYSSPRGLHAPTKVRQFTADQKVAILREHLLEKKPISEVCSAHELQPSVFYDWQRKFFENGPAAFKDHNDRERKRLQAKVDALQKKLDHKDSVIAAVTEEFVRVKKRAWGALNQSWTPHDTRDNIIDFVNDRSQQTDIPQAHFIRWIGIHRSRFFAWKKRYGQVQRAQRQDSPRPLATRLGEEGDLQLRQGVSPRRIPASDLHDAGCRRGGRQPVIGVPGAQRGRPAQPLESNPLQEGHWLHPARGTASALAYDPVWRTSPTSMFGGRSTTCARCSMAAAGSSCITSCKSR